MLNLNGHANEYLERRVKNVESIYYSADEVTMPITSKRISNWKTKLPAPYANLVDIVFNTFDSSNSGKAASGRLLFAIYKIHRLLIKKYNFSGKLYRNIITRIHF